MGLSLRTGKYGSYYGTTKNSSQSLTEDQQRVNATYIAKALTAAGWSLNAIAGILGNMQSESALNPGRWEGEAVGSSSAGYGLIQWTGSTVHTNWDKSGDYSTMDSNIEHIIAEANGNISDPGWYKKKIPNTSINSDISYSEFKQCTNMSPYDLACVFAWNRERSAVVLWGAHSRSKAAGLSETQKEANRKALRDARGGQAQKWYTFLGGSGFNFGGGGIAFPARTTEEQKKKFKADLIANTEDYITSFYRNPAGYYSGKYGIPNHSGGATEWYGNCTAYAYGRFWELAECAKSLTGKQSKPTSVLHGDAGSWYPNNATKQDYNCGPDPKLGAILCFAKEGGAGHVAIVEAIEEKENGDVEITCSESGWKSPILFYQTRTRPKGAAKDAKTNWSDKYQFQGFIYQHYDFDNCPGGGCFGAPQIKSVILTHVTADLIQGQGFLTTEGVTSITCEVVAKNAEGEEVSTEGITLEPIVKESTEDSNDDNGNDSSSSNNTTQDTEDNTGEPSDGASSTGALTLAIDSTKRSFDFQLTGLTPLTTYELTFSATGGGVVSIPNTDSSGEDEGTEEESEDTN
jgi:surface antigen